MAEQALVEDLREIVRRFLDADREAPEFGLKDCIDNTGEAYQSADFASLLIDARHALAKADQALSRMEREDEGRAVTVGLPEGSETCATRPEGQPDA